MKDIIGTFNGRKVYKTNTTDYINQRLYNNEEDIYVINREMIYKNEVFATYDGTYVKELDPHQRYTFYRVEVEDDYKINVTPDGNRHFEVKFTHSTGNPKNETKTSTENLDVDATLAGAYDTDYFSGMTDIDAFLKSALEK